MVAVARPYTDVSYHRVQAANHQFTHVPQELKLVPQWVVWKWGRLRDNGKREKVPINPSAGTPASHSDAGTWGTYLQALLLYVRGDYEGIGFVFNGGYYAGIDLDDCLHNGEIDQWAKEIISQFPGGYVEVSPSGSGVKLIVRGNLEGDRHRVGHIEVYDSARFFTVTGDTLGTVRELVDHQAELDAWYSATFPIHPCRDRQCVARSELEDSQVIAILSKGQSGKKFKQLWAGDISGYPSRSEADLALFAYLAFMTQDEEQIERIARQSGLYREKWDVHPTYLGDSIQKAIDSLTSTYQSRRRVDTRAEHSYGWQELHEERNLLGRAREVRESVRRHQEEGSESVLVVRVPPGVGKSTEVAAWGSDQDIAYIVERHHQVSQIEGLGRYRHIQPCTSKNCPSWKEHDILSRQGYNVWPMHHRHHCEYYQQFGGSGSAVYQIAHAQTSYPTRHSGVVVDEMNLSSWIVEQVITPEMLGKWCITPHVGRAEMLLWGIWNLLETGCPYYGKALFDVLNIRMRGALERDVEAIALDGQLMEVRPHPPADTHNMANIRPVIIPSIINAIQQELPMWKTGREWNSRLRIDRHQGLYALHILEPRRFQGNVPLSILDATACPEFISRLLGRSVQVKEVQIDPPANMRHIAVRTGKRYGKGTLTDAKNRDVDVERVVKEVRYLLRTLDPSGTKSVGIITYQGCEDAIGDALGIPQALRGHFWGIRGRNDFSECEILFVIGTPTPNLDMIVYWARMLYADDPEALDTDIGPDGKFRDARLRNLVDHLINAELTQAAHRSRPLRYDGRTVVTLSSGTVDFLPVTTEITGLPVIKDEEKVQQEQERLRTAMGRLVEQGRKVTVRAMVEALGSPGIRREKIMKFLRARDM